MKSYNQFISESKTILNHSFGLTEDDVDFIAEDWEFLELDELDDLKGLIRQYMTTDFGFDENGKLKGLENFPPEIKLYRIIDVVKKEDIRTDFLGAHWTLNKETIYSKNFQGQIGGISDDSYIIEATFKKENIDAVLTILHQISNDIENEITLFKNTKPIDYKIEKA